MRPKRGAHGSCKAQIFCIQVPTVSEASRFAISHVVRRGTDNVLAVFDPDFWPMLVHESAHATLGQRLGLIVKKIEVTIDGDRLDATTFIDYSKSSLSNYLTVLLAGEEAEQQVFGRHVLPRVHSGSDRERLYLAVVKAGAVGRQELFVARQKAARLVRMHRPSIIRLAGELLGIATDTGLMVEGQQLAAMLDADGSAILRRAIV